MDILLDQTAAAGVANALAQSIGLPARIGPDSSLVEAAGSANTQQDRRQVCIILSAKHAAQTLQHLGIGGERLVAVEAGCDLDAPALDAGTDHAVLELGNNAMHL